MRVLQENTPEIPESHFPLYRRRHSGQAGRGTGLLFCLTTWPWTKLLNNSTKQISLFWNRSYEESKSCLRSPDQSETGLRLDPRVLTLCLRFFPPHYKGCLPCRKGRPREVCSHRGSNVTQLSTIEWSADTQRIFMHSTSICLKPQKFKNIM